MIVPRYVVDEARAYAREATHAALDALFGDGGFVDRELARRRSAAFALERARFHTRMADAVELLGARPGGPRQRRHLRLAARWSALAVARDPRLAAACSLAGCV